MGVQYIPARDGDFGAWLDNFSALISASPTTYGLTSADATNLASVTAAWDSAYAAAISGATRGPMTVNLKDVARVNATAVARTLATIIQANPGITDAQKTALGLTVRKTLPTPIPAPTSSPLLTFIAATPLQHTLRFADQSTPAARAKPFGVQSLQLYVSVLGGPPPTGPGPSNLVFTKNPIAVNFSTDNIGKIATYQAAWITQRGLLGPISAPLTATVV
jgi:hypothetical protein